MQVLDITKQTCEFVTTDEKQDSWYEYIRYSEDNWMISMGQSYETLYNCEKIEKEYQIYKTLHKPIIASKK